MKITRVIICCLFALAACAPRPAAPAAPAPPAPTATPPPATPTAESNCLLGDWVLNNAATESLLAYMTSTPSLTILEGALRIKFGDGTFAFHSDDLFLRTSFLDGFLDARAKVLIEGSYRVEGDVIHYTKTSAQNELYDWRAGKGDETQPFYGSSPVINFSIAEESTFVCNESALTLTFDIPELEGVNFSLVRGD